MPAMNPCGDLLGKMTWKRELGTIARSPSNEHTRGRLKRASKEQTGSCSLMLSAKGKDRLQHIAVERPRLHIPRIWLRCGAWCSTPILSGYRWRWRHSWDPAVGAAGAAYGGYARRVVWNSLDLCTDGDMRAAAREGRMMEGAGERSLSGSRMRRRRYRFPGEDIATQTAFCV